MFAVRALPEESRRTGHQLREGAASRRRTQKICPSSGEASFPGGGQSEYGRTPAKPAFTGGKKNQPIPGRQWLGPKIKNTRNRSRVIPPRACVRQNIQSV